MFRNRQSSFAVLPALPPKPDSLSICGQAAPNTVASRTPLQFFTGIGSRQRNAPIGGRAKGIPLKADPPFARTSPRISPPVTETTGAVGEEGLREACCA